LVLFQSSTLKPYLVAVKRTLEAAMCLENFSSQKVERHNKPEIEIQESPGNYSNTDRSFFLEFYDFIFFLCGQCCILVSFLSVPEFFLPDPEHLEILSVNMSAFSSIVDTNPHGSTIMIYKKKTRLNIFIFIFI
jgi:hypothetical protein